MQVDTALLRSSLDKIRPIAGQVSDRFYENLWNDYPESRALFRDTDMGPQKFAFFNALAHVIENLEKPQELESFLKGLGAAHITYGVQEHHYGWMNASLLKTLSQFFTGAWTEALAREWANVFSYISAHMLDGAKEHGKGVVDNPDESLRHARTLAEDVAHQAAIAAGLEPGPMEPSKQAPADWAEHRPEPTFPLTAPKPVDLPLELRQRIRSSVQDAIRETIREEVDRITREEVERLGSNWAEFLKKAA